MCVLAALQNPVAINISFSVDTIAAVEKNTEIFDLQRCLYDHRNRDSLLQCFCLVIAVGWSAAIDLLNSRLFLNLPSFFFFFFGLFHFCQKHCISLSLSFTLETQNHSSLSLSSSHSPSKTQNPTQTLFISSSLSLSLSDPKSHHHRCLHNNPTTTTKPCRLSDHHLATPIHLVGVTQQPQSTSSPSPHFNPPHKFFLFFYFLLFMFNVLCYLLFCSMCYVQCAVSFFIVCLVIYQDVFQSKTKLIFEPKLFNFSLSLSLYGEILRLS